MKQFIQSVLVFFSIATAALTAVAQTLDSFNPSVNGVIEALAVQPDGKVWMGGAFTVLNGQPDQALARLKADGTVDIAFNPGATTVNNTYAPQIIALLIQPDGKVIAGGWFTSFGGISRNNIVRFNSDGGIDSTFNPGYTTGIITSLAMQSDGKILAISGFNIFRINPDGSRDTTFNVATSGSIATYFAIQTDGKILVLGGVNLVVSNVTYSVNGLGRVSSDGAYDAGFNYFGSLANNSGVPIALTIQSDGKIVVGNYAPRYVICGPGGGFCIDHYDVLLTRITSSGAFETNVATVHQTFDSSGLINVLTMQANGKFIAGSSPIERVNAVGGVDTNFNTTAAANVMALQPDGNLLFGGPAAGRIVNNEAPTQGFSLSGSTLTWMRGGSSPEVWRTTFEYSTNGADWAVLGPGARISGGWQRTGVSVPTNAMLRARGFIVAGDSSSWYVEKLLNLNPVNPVILVHDGNFGVISNQFRFNFSGAQNSTVVIDGSTNTVDWSPLQTNTLGTGPLSFHDPAWRTFSRRFYRARLLP